MPLPALGATWAANATVRRVGRPCGGAGCIFRRSSRGFILHLTFLDETCDKKSALPPSHPIDSNSFICRMVKAEERAKEASRDILLTRMAGKLSIKKMMIERPFHFWSLLTS